MRDQTIQLLYPLLEARVLARRGNRTDREYLAVLGEELPALRRQYFTADVAVDYTAPETADRYLLAYFPHYVFCASAAFARIPCDFFAVRMRGGLDITCVGGGPLPELVALVDRLLDCGIGRGTIRLTSVDLNTDTWAVAVRDTVAIAKVLAPGLDVQIAPRRRNCASPRDPREQALPDCDVLVVQNCLNEIARSSHFPAHGREMADSVRRGGFLLISDLTEYDRVTGVVPAYEAALEQRGYRAIARFDERAEAARSPFARNVPSKSYWAFFGYAPDPTTGEVRFPDWRRPKAWIRFSTAAWQRL
jgi:SAM-dependent methyltransferase